MTIVILALIALVISLGINAWFIYWARLENDLAELDLARVADVLLVDLVSEFKSDLIPNEQWRPYVRTQYTLMCAEFGLPREQVGRVMEMIEDRLWNNAVIDDMTVQDNFLFDGEQENGEIPE